MYQLEKVQHRSTKLIKEISWLPYEERLKILHLPSLYALSDLIETFKILKGFTDINPNTFLRETPVAGQEDTASNYIRRNLEQRLKHKHFFSNRIINSWNQLP